MKKEKKINFFNRKTIFITLLISLLAILLLTTGCCQLGSGVTSFLENVKDQQESGDQEEEERHHGDEAGNGDECVLGDHGRGLSQVPSGDSGCTIFSLHEENKSRHVMMVISNARMLIRFWA